MNQFLGILSLGGLTLSALTHIAALFGIDMTKEVPAIMGLNFGIIVMAIIVAWQSRKVLGARPSLAQLRQQFPAWVIWTGGLLLVYTLVNLILLTKNTEGGTAVVQDGKYILQSHGHFIRELGASEYVKFQTNIVRRFSGHWILFYFLDCAWFLWRKKLD